LKKHRVFKLIIWTVVVILLLVLVPASVLITNIVKDYKPDDKTMIEENPSFDTIHIDSVSSFNLMSWNIGYCGLSNEMDFFYDGGTKVRPSKEKVFENYIEIQDFLQNDSITDFFLLQEVDNKSKRSYKMKEYDNLWGLKLLDGYSAYYAINYKVWFVPLPLTNPMGKVESGLVSITRFKPKSVIRISYPSLEKFPMKYFMLDRCIMVIRCQLSNGKDLTIINTHNSAFDDGSQRKLEMNMLKKYLLQEFEAGNYVIAGGDWNQVPPGFKPDFKKDSFDPGYSIGAPDNFLPDGWTWAFDNRVPTNRKVDKAYSRGTTGTTVIDYFIVSPNLKVDSIANLDMEFRHSDHNPVTLTVSFR